MKMKNSENNINKRTGGKGFTVFLVIFFSIFCFLGGYFVNYLVKDPALKTAEWVLETVEKYGYYLDEETGEVKKLTGEEIADLIVSGLLDKYSAYYTAEEYSDVVSTNKGNNFGVGVSFLKDTDDLSVFKVVGNSPASHAGIKKGDVIVGGRMAGGDKIPFATREDLTLFLSSVGASEEFSLYVERDDAEEAYTLSKSVFTSSYVTYFDKETKGVFVEDTGSENGLQFVTAASDEMSELPDGVAYIKFDSFSGKASFEIKTVMEYIKENNLTGLILDLRDNGGGQMNILSEVSSYFVKSSSTDKPIIAFAKEADGRTTHFTASGNNFNDDITKISVIANNYTASASECLIAAMLHYGASFDRHNLIIEEGDGATGRTYGKGIMQSTFIRPSTGEALKITVAKIYFPDGVTSIHGEGMSTYHVNRVLPSLALSRTIEVMQGN